MGWETVGFCERDAYCKALLSKRFPKVRIHEDIKTLPAKSFFGVNVLTGGFPCQPFSTAGKRKGRDDDRYLWPEMLRVIKDARPTWVVGENVAGIRSVVFHSGPSKVESRTLVRREDSDFYKGVLSRQEVLQLGKCCKDLEDAGYTVQPLIIPACAVGAFHRRDRVWILARSTEDSDCTFNGGSQASLKFFPEYWNIGTAGSMGTSPNSASKGVGGLPVQSWRPRQASLDAIGRGQVTADTYSTGAQRRTVPTGNGEDGTESHDEYARRCDLASPSDTSSKGLPDWAGGEMGQPSPLTQFERSTRGGKEREVEYDFRGMAYGVSRRVDRLRALGNAIVPQIAFRIFQAIQAAENSQ